MILMILSYQNCAEDFNISQYQNASAENNSSSDDSEVNNPPVNPGVDYSSLFLSLNNESQRQFDTFEARVLTDLTGLVVSMSYQCPGSVERNLQASSCQNHVGYCVSFVCEQAGSALVRASVFNTSTGNQLLIDERSLTVLSVEKQTLNAAIELDLPTSALLNSNFTVGANVLSSLRNDSNFNLDWSISPSGSCIKVNSNNQEATFNCNSPGTISIKANASSSRYQAENSASLQIGDPNLNLYLKLYNTVSSDEVNVGHDYSVDILGQNGVSVSGYNWNVDSSSNCSFANASTVGIRNTLTCSQVPSAGSIRLSVSVSGNGYFSGTATKTLKVNKGSYRVGMGGLAVKNAGESQIISLGVNKVFVKSHGQIISTIYSYSGITFKWTLCIDKAKGDPGRVKVISGSNMIYGQDTACATSGVKTFKVEVSSPHFEGSTEQSVVINEKPPEYFWSSKVLTGSGVENIRNSCASLNKGECNASNLGKSHTCCMEYGTYGYCKEPVYYKCEEK